jgi:hypothetical protein
VVFGVVALGLLVTLGVLARRRLSIADEPAGSEPDGGAGDGPDGRQG